MGWDSDEKMITIGIRVQKPRKTTKTFNQDTPAEHQTGYLQTTILQCFMKPHISEIQ
jgi:hypothetical protein